MKKTIPFMMFLSMVLSLLPATGCGKDSKSPAEPGQINTDTLSPDPYTQNKLIGRSINLGNALEAPNEGDWGVTLEAGYFKLIKEAGFDAVRIPVRWSTHTTESAPYTIEPSFLGRVDWAINEALANDLSVIFNIHHFEEIMRDPVANKEKFLSLWDQLSDHYKNYPSNVMFEILNEPHEKLTPEIWNVYLADAIRLIRQENPKRTLVAGTAEWGGIAGLSKLVLPEDDRNIIVSVHYYNPFEFTHQGAEWVDNSEPWLGTTWLGTSSEKQAIDKDLDLATQWAESRDRPLNIGEFGAYHKADIDSRVRWTTYFARQAEAGNLSWTYWEFCSGFGAYDRDRKDWNQLLLNALVPR